MDWVHCNTCFYRPGQQPKKELILTSCGHIFCKFCERSAQIECCKECRARASTVPLSSEMPNDVRSYFEDPETAIERIVKIMEFQKSHRFRLNDYNKVLWEKYQKLKFAYQKLQEENKQLRKENNMYRNGLLTPPPPPHFGNKNQEYPFRLTSQENRSPNSPFFATPRPVSSSQMYRQQNTPSTPMSDSGVSPGSVNSQDSYQSAASRRSDGQQRMYRPGLTPPPINRLSLRPANPERRASRF